MPRIRTIKPELPQSQTIGRLSRDARLLFIQLFTVADDAGRARAASRLLASLLYPYDDDAPGLIDTWLGELEHHKQIRRYEVDGSEYLEIVKWLEHQKIDRPSPSRLPEYREGSLPPRDHSRGSDADLGPSTKDLGPHTAAGAEAPPSVCDRFEDFWKEYPQRDGDNPKLPAKLKFDALVKTGVDPELMIAGAKRYAAKAREKQQIGTQYIAHALKWLSEQRWADIAAVAFVASERPAEPTAQDWDGAVKRWLGNESHWPRWAGNSPGGGTCRCPSEVLIANGIDPESGRPIGKLVPIVAGTEEMAALIEFRQGIRLRPPRVFEVENDGRVQTLCWAETRWPKTYNDFGEKIGAPASEDEEKVA
jgi:hypothetical protein